MNKLVEKTAQKLTLKRFKKGGSNWRKENGDLIYLINIQKSRFNIQDERFTINVAIFSKDVFKLCWPDTKVNNPKEHDSVFRQRISYFMNTNTDKWWELSTEEVEAAAQEIQAILDSKVLNFFDKINTEEELAKFMLDLPLPKQDDLYILQLAALLYSTNNRSQAFEFIKRISNKSTWHDKADEVIQKMI